MMLWIHRDAMTSDHTRHTARPVPGAIHAWEVTWLPGRHLSRDEAVTAMVLADVTARQYVTERHWVWHHVEGWAAELGLTTPDALSRTAARPKRAPAQKTADHDVDRTDPEAGE
jgi:glyoxylate carboligase